MCSIPRTLSAFFFSVLWTIFPCWSGNTQRKCYTLLQRIAFPSHTHDQELYQRKCRETEYPMPLIVSKWISSSAPGPLDQHTFLLNGENEKNTRFGSMIPLGQITEKLEKCQHSWPRGWCRLPLDWMTKKWLERKSHKKMFVNYNKIWVVSLHRPRTKHPWFAVGCSNSGKAFTTLWTMKNMSNATIYENWVQPWKLWNFHSSK